MSTSAETDRIVADFRKHYAARFALHGATSRGVDWGEPSKLPVRYAKMLDVIEPGATSGKPVSLLDAGCGYGGLLGHAKAKGLALDYTGIDVVSEMINHARGAHPDAQFLVGDVFSLSQAQSYDYAVCNGILTLKLEASLADMDRFARRLVQKLFSLARRGIAFNVMSSYVDFTGPNGYHKSPVEMLAWCAAELSPRIRLDHAYAPYEYTVFVYRPEPPETPEGPR
jgi:SAM-dependent methyltransferase